MDYLPIFTMLKDRPVLVVGGGEVALRKIRLLQNAEAIVYLVAKNIHPDLQTQIQQQKIYYLGERFSEEMLNKMYLVFATSNNSELNQRIKTAADHACKWVNVVDDGEKCSFIMPAIVDRSPLMVAISTGGSAPVMARQIRTKLETLLPFSLAELANVSGKLRGEVKQHLSNMQDKRHFWESQFKGKFAKLIESNQTEKAIEHFRNNLSQFCQHPSSTKKEGLVTLVGAGPGDPGLLTLHALHALQDADVVLYDALVSPEILELIRRDAEQICVGKRAKNHQVVQERTNQLLVEHAQQGKKVLRLKGGDPFIFGRGGEELQVLKNAGITYRVIPGITAALGAATYSGIPLTHRDYAQSVVFVTGHCQKGMNIDWHNLAKQDQTLVIYMGLLSIASIQNKLIEHGQEASCPVAIISHATHKNQSIKIGQLKDLEDLAEQTPSPAIVIIGKVAKLTEQLAWFHNAKTDISLSAIHEPR